MVPAPGSVFDRVPEHYSNWLPYCGTTVVSRKNHNLTESGDFTGHYPYKTVSSDGASVEKTRRTKRGELFDAERQELIVNIEKQLQQRSECIDVVVCSVDVSLKAGMMHSSVLEVAVPFIEISYEK